MPRITRQIALATTLGAGLFSSLGLSCGGDYGTGPTGQPAIHNCPVTKGSNWPASGDVYVDKPADCPFSLSGPKNVDYAAHGSFIGNVTPNMYQLDVYNSVGTLVASMANATWSYNGNNLLSVTGYYQAGSGGFNSGNWGYDNVYNRVYSSGGWRSTLAEMDFKYGFPNANITAPDSAGGGMTFSASASTDDIDFIPPVTYAWTLDGSPVGGNSPSVQLTAPAAGVTASIGVTMTDGNGVTYMNGHLITGCSGLIC